MEFSLVRAPIDQSTGKPFEKCDYALFPGLSLAKSEPELIVLLYDSILHQHSDTAMFLYKARDGADPLLRNRYTHPVQLLPEGPCQILPFHKGKSRIVPDLMCFGNLRAHLPVAEQEDQLVPVAGCQRGGNAGRAGPDDRDLHSFHSVCFLSFPDFIYDNIVSNIYCLCNISSV